jgi:hypothetical protein
VRLARYALGLCFLLPGCTASQTVASQTTTPAYVDYSKLSLRLKPGMSEADVINSLGPPTKTELSTCGQDIGKPWTCKVLFYGAWNSNSLLSNGVIIFFATDSTGAWTVNAWKS